MTSFLQYTFGSIFAPSLHSNHIPCLLMGKLNMVCKAVFFCYFLSQMTCLVAAVARVGAVSLMQQVRLRLRAEMIDADGTSSGTRGEP
jgi:hypothetical protein